MLYVRGEMNRPGFLKSVVLSTDRGTAVTPEVLAERFFSQIEEKLVHWQKDLSRQGGSTTGMITRGKAISYVEWAQGLGFLVSPYFTWSRHAELLSRLITDEEIAALTKSGVLQPNPLLLTQQQQLLMLKRLLDSDGAVLIPLLSRIRSLSRFESSDVYPLIQESLLEGIRLGLRLGRSDIYEADQQERMVSDYRADTLRQKTLPRLEPLVDIGLLRKVGTTYYPIVDERTGRSRLDTLFHEFRDLAILDQKLRQGFFESVAHIFGIAHTVPKQGYVRRKILEAYARVSRRSMQAVYADLLSDWIGIKSLLDEGILVDFDGVVMELKAMANQDEDVSLATNGQGSISTVTFLGDLGQIRGEEQ